MARGYFGNPELTEKAFIEMPAFFGDGLRRFYRTGDLVKYTDDGSIEYIGRRDTQIKLAGQRIDLAQIEHCMQQCVPSRAQVCVVIAAERRVLVGLVCEKYCTKAVSVKGAWTAEGLRKSLEKLLPAYMIPGAFFEINRMPSTPTGKIDRRRLAEMSSDLLMECSEPVEALDSSLGPPTEAEALLQKLWAEVLRVRPQLLHSRSNFLQLGDSVSAMKLANFSRKAGMRLDVATIFAYPVLGDMAKAAGDSESPEKEAAIEPFSLFGEIAPVETLADARAAAAAQCGTSSSAIEDIYPSTALQEGLMALSIKDPGAYIAHHVLRLQPCVDVEKFRTAFETVVAANPILRTRLVSINNKIVQAVIREGLEWLSAEDVSSYLAADRKRPVVFGGPMVRLGLVQQGGHYELIFTAHHAVYDGWSISLILEQVEQAYANAFEAPAITFRNFISKLAQTDREASVRYWSTQLQDVEALTFPPVPTTNREPRADRVLVHRCPFARPQRSDITSATFIRAAWSILVGQHCLTDDVVIGTTISGRAMPLAGIDEIVGPTIATVPVRVRLVPSQTVENFLRQMQDQSTEMIPHEQFGLRNISRLGADADAACNFQSLLVVQPDVKLSEGAAFTADELRVVEEVRSYALTMQVRVEESELSLTANYDPVLLDGQYVTWLLNQMEHLLQRLLADPLALLQDIKAFGARDAAQIKQWTPEPPEFVNRCVHEVFMDRVRETPDKVAVHSWDGDVTYAELDELSTRLAWHLSQLGVVAEDAVPILSEKSLWTEVALLGAIKAGATFVLLDPDHPPARLQGIVADVEAKFILSSAQFASLAQSLGNLRVVVVGEAMIAGLPRTKGLPPSGVSPRHALYIHFSSGTTGKPKGSIIEHCSYSSSAAATCRAMDLSPEPDSANRVLHFASHSYDQCIGEMLGTIMHGGCLCIPSDFERNNDVVGAINKYHCTRATFTPSFGRLVSPADVPCLRVVVVGGEAMAEQDIEHWRGVQLFNAYGPSETTVSSCIKRSPGIDGSDYRSIGYGIDAARYYIVEPGNPDQLTPLGGLGEVVIDGPTVAREYLKEPEKSKAAFVDRPSWLPYDAVPPGRKLYRTGDMARYASNGEIIFLGRRDTQVKLRSQRLELAEVDHHIARLLPASAEVVSDVVVSATSSTPMLAAFIRLKNNAQHDDGNANLLDEDAAASPEWASLRDRIDGQLAKLLPGYMIPSVYVPLKRLPFTRSHKVERKQLRALVAAFSAEQLATFSHAARHKRLPTNAMERQMRAQWAVVLGMEAESISIDDNFFRLGGDSIDAMKLVATVRAQGVHLTMAIVFQHPRLMDMCLAASTGSTMERGDDVIPPFSLIEAAQVNELRQEACRQCRISPALIEDIYPCTPLQEGMLAVSMKRPGMEMAQMSFTLPSRVNLDRFKRSWEAAVRRNAILRTRLISTEAGAFQVVTSEHAEWTSAYGLQEYLRCDRAQPMADGDRLTRFALVADGGLTSETHCVLTIHHALYDGWSWALLERAVEDAYAGEPPLKAPPFNRFVRYLQHQARDEAGTKFWTDELTDCDAAVFPSLPAAGHEPTADGFIQRHIELVPSGITAAALLRAAWALVVAAHTGRNDVVFGVTVTGRTAPVTGIEHMLGPTFVTVPFRVRIDRSESPAGFLQRVQEQAGAMQPFEHVGLPAIARASPAAAEACRFQNVLVVQAGASDENLHQPGDDGGVLGQRKDRDAGLATFNNYALMLECEPSRGGVQINASFDPRLLGHVQMRRVINQFAHAARELLRCADMQQHSIRLRELDLVSPEDYAEIAAWNRSPPVVIEKRVHDIIEERAAAAPDAEAVCAWDGSLTYRQLNDQAGRVAARLRGLGAAAGCIVPVAFEKSMWAVVAMLAVLKSGAAFALLDPVQHPASRVQELAGDISAKVVVCSPTHANIFEGRVEHIVALSSDIVKSLPAGELPKDACTPDDPFCVMFTSGSTGKPKAILHTHSGLASSFEAFGPCLNVNPGSRVFQFAAYAFDASVGDNIATLMQGGCICVPSDADRMGDFAGAFARLRANYVHVTPSLGRQLQPDELPGLRTLMLGGEMLQQTELRRWAHRARLISGYGPAESSLCTAGTLAPGVREPPNLGFPVGCRMWVADAEDATRLAPVGVVGQLVVEGPVNAAGGYLNDAERTAKSFVMPGTEQYTKWDPGNGVTNTQRMFRTGDLVRYAADGTVEFVERADTQIKLRGQRVEVAEVECAMLEALAAEGFHGDSAIGQVAPTDGASVLAAFLCFDDGKASPETLQRLLSGITTALSGRLLPYMIPTVIIPIEKMPRTASNKVDRKQLRAMGAELSPDQLASLSRVDGRAGRKPTTSPEKTLCALVARVLGVPEAQVYADDMFARLGGDSIQGMRLVATAREHGLSFTVADLFKEPTIAALAKKSASSEVLAANKSAGPTTTTTIDRRRSSGFTRRFMFEVVARAQGWDARDIQDLYPCTPLQEGLMSLSLERHGAYVSHNVFELPDGLNADRFRSAWARVVADNAILRTRIVQLEGSGATVQIVLDEAPQWQIDEGASLAQVIEEERGIKVELGSPLNRWREVVEGSKRFLVWTAHHSTYDGWSMKLVIEQVEATYRGAATGDHPLFSPRPAFRSFVSDVEASAERSRTFWKKEFEGKPLTTFPPPPGPGCRPRVTRFESRKVEIRRKKGSRITTPTLIRAAWALLLRQHSDEDNSDGGSSVLFGTVSSGRSSSSLPGIERVVGPTMCTLPAAVHVDEAQSVSRYLDDVQAAWLEALPHEHFGLQNLARLGGGCRAACAFTNLLVVQPRELRDATANEVTGRWQDSENETGFFSYPLTCQCSLDDDGAEVMLGYDDSILLPRQGAWLLRQFMHLIELLAEAEAGSSNISLAELDTTGTEDWKQLREWDEEARSIQAAPTPENDMCIPERMSSRAQAEPDRQAICSWDGSFSYHRVDELSDKLARHLNELGVTHGTLVPFCFDKSAWAVIAVLSVLKAGGAFVPLDPSYPRAWLQDVVNQTRAQVIVASPERGALCSSLGTHAVEVSAELLDSLNPPDKSVRSKAQLNTTACVIFTSGSTGRPKGVVTTHASLSRGATDHGHALRINRDARVLHFASYVFDASIMEMLTTLAHGGCVCVPSPEERATDIVAAMARTNANWALFTPSFARTLAPDKVAQYLRTLVVGGEAAAPDTLATWAERLCLINAYGPAENCVITSVAAGLRPNDRADRIGRPVSGRCWVVRAHSGGSGSRLALAPLGAVGELVVEAETLAQGYLNEPEKTAEAFVTNAGWKAAAGKRMYRTGDLVRYDADGSLCYVGRKDSMIKLRGQRMELGPIEALVRQEMQSVDAGVKAVAAEQIAAPGRPGAQLLAVFLGLDSQEEEPRVLELSEHLRISFVKLQDRLRKKLPPQMVPTMFVPLTRMPLTLAGKTDRKRLRALVDDLSPQQAAHLCLTATSAAGTRNPPTSPAERALHALWVEVLRLPADAVGREDGFFQLGGDSISAMRLATLARERGGLRLTVASIFTNTTLASMAAAARLLDDDLEEINGEQNGDEAPSKPSDSLCEVVTKAAPGSFGKDDIEDIVPATDYQAWTLGATHLRSRGYNNYLILKGKGGEALDPSRLAAACRALVCRHQILRTVFIANKQTLLQVALHADNAAIEGLVEEIEENDEATIINNDMQAPRRMGSSPVHFFITKSSSLIIRIAHALYDGVSLPILLQDLKSAYYNEQLDTPSVPFSRFARTLHQRDPTAAQQHWRSLLNGSPNVTELVESGSAPSHRHPMASSVSALARPNNAALSAAGVTPASLVKAAWAATLAQMTPRSTGPAAADVVFGAITVGRSDAATHPAAVGPCMNIVPVRARVGAASTTTARGLVADVHAQHVAALPHEWLGFRRVVEACSGWPAWARWSSIVQHNNFAVTLDGAVAEGAREWRLESFAPAHDVADVWVLSEPADEGALRVEFNFCRERIAEGVARRMLELLCANVEGLAESLEEGAEERAVLGREVGEVPVIPVSVPAAAAAAAAAIINGVEEVDPAMVPEARRLVDDVWAEVFSKEQQDKKACSESTPFFELWGEAVLAAAHLSDVYYQRTDGRVDVAVEDLMDAPTKRAQVELLAKVLGLA